MKQKLSAFIFSFLLIAVWLAIPMQASAAATVSITSPSAGEELGKSFTVEGTATANSTIQVYINDAAEASTTADGSGNWSVDITNQTDGAKTIEARVTAVPEVYFSTFSGGADDIYVFDSSNDSQIAGSPFDVGEKLSYWDVNNDGSTVYGSDSTASSTYYELDVDAKTVTARTVAGATLGQPVLSPDGSRLYMVDSVNDEIVVINTSNHAVVNTISTAVALGTLMDIDPEGENLYVSGVDIYVVNLASEVLTTIDVTNGCTGGLRVDHAGDFLYCVASGSPGALLTVDLSTESQVGPGVNVGSGAVGLDDIAILPDDSKVYVANANDSSVSVYDVEAATITGTLAVGALVNGIEETSDGTKVYAVAAGNIFDAGQNGGMWVVDTSDDSVTQVFDTDDGSIAPIAYGDFIVEQTASTSVSATVVATSSSSDDGEQLADTGTPTALLIASSILLLSTGLFLRLRYRQIF